MDSRHHAASRSHKRRRQALKPGSTYSIGFAVHDNNTGGRGHFVSFVRSIGFGGEGKIKAVKLP